MQRKCVMHKRETTDPMKSLAATNTCCIDSTMCVTMRLREQEWRQNTANEHKHIPPLERLILTAHISHIAITAMLARE